MNNISSLAIYRKLIISHITIIKSNARIFIIFAIPIRPSEYRVFYPDERNPRPLGAHCKINTGFLLTCVLYRQAFFDFASLSYPLILPKKG